MARSIPKAREGFLHQETVETTSPHTLSIGTAAWYRWLEQHSSFTFETPHVTFTARKEQRPGGWYWYAYRRRQGKLHSAYLGKSAELTLERLNAAAEALEGAGEALAGGTHRPPGMSGDHALQVHQASIIAFPTPSTGAERLKEPEPVPNHTLPVQLTPLIGREQDAASAAALLRRPAVRLLTMIGTAGIGKTRLAVQVASDLLHDFLHGVSFVSLAPIRDPDLVLPTIAQALGLKENAGETVADRLKTYLHRKHCLLVLDNFEHVITAAPLLVELLAACPQLKLLVTSREVLYLRAEQQFSVPPLALPDLKRLPEVGSLVEYAAVDLFTQRAQAVNHDFHLNKVNAQVIAEICTRLDGLPLAIELAAACTKYISPQALLARLERRLQVLGGGARDLPERQQTLRKTIQWSYELLNAEEQRLFRRLSIFVGGCGLEAIEAVCVALGDGDGEGQLFERITSLIDKSLLQTTGQEGVEPRFMMLETIREYGLECLNASKVMEATRQTHAQYYLALAEQAEPELTGPSQAVWLERLEQEHDNLRAALQWSLERDGIRDKEVALRLGGALMVFWLIRGYASEGQIFFERALAAREGVTISVRAKTLVAASGLLINQGDTDRAEVLCKESLALYRKLGETLGIALSLYLLGGIARTRGDLVVAHSLIEEALALWKDVGEKERIANSLLQLGLMANLQGEYVRARGLLEESLALHKELGNKGGMADALFQLAQVLFFSQSDPTTMRVLFEEGLVLFRELGDKDGIAQSLCFLGQVALGQGNTVQARLLAEESLGLFRDIGERLGIAESLCLLANLTALQGNYAAARALYEQSLLILKEADEKWDIAYNLEGLAGVVAAQGDPGWAARLWGMAETLRADSNMPLPPVYRADYERSVATARVQLGERAFAAAWAEGRTMTPEQAPAAERRVMKPGSGEPSSPLAKSLLTYPNELTAREVDVLRLLAQGLTSAQIAEQLFLSPLTVNTHVRSIYSKLGVTSRSAATRWVIEHQVV